LRAGHRGSAEQPGPARPAPRPPESTCTGCAGAQRRSCSA
jgi:hypothetical protein